MDELLNLHELIHLAVLLITFAWILSSSFNNGFRIYEYWWFMLLVSVTWLLNMSTSPKLSLLSQEPAVRPLTLIGHRLPYGQVKSEAQSHSSCYCQHSLQGHMLQATHGDTGDGH
jgi:hypothetical protein